MSDCDGKVRFESWALAARVCMRKKKTEKSRGPYFCEDCKGFHLGGRKSKEAREHERRPYDEGERFDLEGRN